MANLSLRSFGNLVNITRQNYSGNSLANLTAKIILSNVTSASSWGTLVMILGTISANAVFLIAYARNRSLRTPFSIYLLALSLSDMSQALFVDPGVFLTGFTNIWPLGRTVCSLYQYAVFAVFGMQFSIHLLISLNRLWAVTFPVHYREHHNRRVATVAALSAWLYVNLWVLPAVITDSKFPRKSTNLACFFNYEAQGMWAFWVNIWMYDFPGVVILTVYPVIMWKSTMRSRLKALIAQKIVASGSQTSRPSSRRVSAALRAEINNGSPDQAEERKESGTKREPTDVAPRRFSVSPAFTFRRTGSEVSQLTTSATTAAPAVRTHAHIRVLTLLVVGVVICWTPICTYFTITGFTRYYNVTFVQVANFLYHANSLLNPIIYPLASPEWRRAFKQVLHL